MDSAFEQFTNAAVSSVVWPLMKIVGIPASASRR